MVAAAGDIACPSTEATFTSCQQMATSEVVLSINPDAVLALGDLQYHEGKYEDYLNYYDPSWGRFKDITHPVPGNHDSTTGFYEYFYGSANGGGQGRGYYSFDLGTWHLIALNSNCADAGGCEEGSAQGHWLRRDLASHAVQCTLAYWHHSYYTSGTRGRTEEVRPFVTALYGHHADLLLVAHNHFYQRFSPQDPDGNLDPSRGLREIIVGTGGGSLRPFDPANRRNSEAFDATTFGVLKVTLRPLGYDWEFIPAAGYSFTDEGSDICR